MKIYKIPEPALLHLYQNGNYDVKIYSDGTKVRTTEDDERYISYAEVQENETYKEIIRRLELRSGYILNLNYPNEEFYIQRPIYSDGYGDEIIFDNDFYADLDNVLDFIENPEWRMGVHEYRDG